MDHKEMSRKGGLAKSHKKTLAVRKNAKKPRRRWVTAIAYEIRGIVGERTGLLLMPGKLLGSSQERHDKICMLIKQETGKEVVELLDYVTAEKLI